MTIDGGRKFAACWRVGNLLVIARRWIEPQGSAAHLPRVPDRNDLLRIGYCFAVEFAAPFFPLIFNGQDGGQLAGTTRA
jgi:hypothetical protein